MPNSSQGTAFPPCASASFTQMWPEKVKYPIQSCRTSMHWNQRTNTQLHLLRAQAGGLDMSQSQQRQKQKLQHGLDTWLNLARVPDAPGPPLPRASPPRTAALRGPAVCVRLGPGDPATGAKLPQLKYKPHLLCHAPQRVHTLQIEGLQTPRLKQAYRCCFSTAVAQFQSLCHILVILLIFQTFSLVTVICDQ